MFFLKTNKFFKKKLKKYFLRTDLNTGTHKNSNFSCIACRRYKRYAG